eukprot:CAMPEP_0168617502 /NCGR_PEP_ID=MMETSP0449_2-20121227/5575_1 /TAXON_ID=1082188 /ORGANISM="Strombidium rassoulzadegani, Strain ras09" /LENGTH=67 /DNA_ID=CAMNT_0008658319 /DNA_START=58 /DNA_END=262 /DNA_ORIENTATION=+
MDEASKLKSLLIGLDSLDDAAPVHHEVSSLVLVAEEIDDQGAAEDVEAEEEPSELGVASRLGPLQWK